MKTSTFHRLSYAGTGNVLDLWCVPLIPEQDEVIEEISKLSLQGGLEQAVNILAAGRSWTAFRLSHFEFNLASLRQVSQALNQCQVMSVAVRISVNTLTYLVLFHGCFMLRKGITPQKILRAWRQETQSGPPGRLSFRQRGFGCSNVIHVIQPSIFTDFFCQAGSKLV